MTAPNLDENTVFAGVDVGGTNLKIGFVTADGKVLMEVSIPTESERGPEDAVERIAAEIESMQHQTGARPLAIGLGTPGTMDIPRGMILEPPNLPAWRHFAIVQALSSATSTPVAFANDANAAAYGEYWVGSGQEYDSMILLTLGTGVGGGIIIFDRTIDGVNSLGGELGHTLVDTSTSARTCSCGKAGHLEAYASATAVVKRTEEALAQTPSSLAEVQRQTGTLNAVDIYRHAEQGDELARRMIWSTADFLAIGITNAAHTIDPDAVVLGGAMDFGGNQSPVGREFLQRIRQETRRLGLEIIGDRLVIEFASLGGRAGFIGAAGIARNRYCNRTLEV